MYNIFGAQALERLGEARVTCSRGFHVGVTYIASLKMQLSSLNSSEQRKLFIFSPPTKRQNKKRVPPPLHGVN